MWSSIVNTASTVCSQMNMYVMVRGYQLDICTHILHVMSRACTYYAYLHTTARCNNKVSIYYFCMKCVMILLKFIIYDWKLYQKFIFLYSITYKNLYKKIMVNFHINLRYLLRIFHYLQIFLKVIFEFYIFACFEQYM